MSTFVISLGGSLICPEAGKVNTVFLKKFRAVILKYVKRGNRFAIIVGGGKVARQWQEALRKLHNPPHSALSSWPKGQPSLILREGDRSFLPLLKGEIKRGLDNDLDLIGIRATQLNAELVRAMFGDAAHNAVVLNPAQKVSKFKILVGAGYEPGHSTDYDSVVRAKTLGAKVVVNLSDVQYVYDKDPDKYKDARPLKNITWNRFFKIIGTDKFKPGMNVPFDPTATKFAARHGISVAFMRGKDIGNFANFLNGKPFFGTIIS